MNAFFIKSCALLLSACMICSFVPGGNAVAAGEPGGGQPVRFNSPPATGSLPDLSAIVKAKEALTPAERKISTSLLELIKPELLPAGTTRQQLIERLQTGRQLSRGPSGSHTDALLAYVYITFNEGAGIDDLVGFSASVTDSAPEYGLAVARVEVGRLAELAQMDAVKSIEVVTAPECSANDSVTSEGDTILGADKTRAQGGVDGSGVKIGVISSGVDHYSASVASGDLPAGVNVLSNAQGGDEGTAMLEVVHDLAPGAQLFFHDCGDNKVQFMAAIDELVAAGCDVICDDVKWYSEPFFEDGDVASHIANVLASKNVVYCTSSGNLAKRHYQGLYYPGEGGYHDFTRGGNATNKYLYLNIQSGGTVEIWLQWDEKHASASSDYDLYLCDYKSGTIVAHSTYSQTGSQNPYEYIYYTNAGAGADFVIYVAPYASSVAAKTLEVVVSPGDKAFLYSSNVTASDSIVGHAAVPGVITCGAVNHASPNILEDFSSMGPVTTLTGTRKKPDICGVDGVSITGAGGFGGAGKEFTGTSAAAPHVAAISALVWQKHPGLTAAQVRARICGYAQDLGAAGYDSGYGYGRVNANAAVLGSVSLSAPSSLRQTGSASTSVTLGWQAVSYADGYELWRAASSGGTYSLVSTTKSTTATNSGLKTNRTYYYKVRAYWNAAKKSYGGFSAVASAKPVPSATVLKAKSVSYKSVKLTWSTVAGATKYELYRSTSPTSGFRRTRTTVSQSFTDTDRITGRTYYYKARAYRLVSGKKVYGSFSSVVSVATGLGVPATVKAEVVSSGSIKLKWGKVAGRTKYEVWRCATSATGTYTLVKTTSSTSYTNAGLTVGKTVWYKVRAYRMAGGKKVCGNYSSVAGIMP